MNCSGIGDRRFGTRTLSQLIVPELGTGPFFLGGKMAKR